jgi:putative ABC transport system permease protein
VRATLVVTQTALALVLLVGAGLMVRSVARLLGVDAGFDPRNVLAIQLSLPASKYGRDEQRVAFFAQLLDRVSALPGVRAAGAINYLPLAGLGSATGFWVEGRPAPPPGQVPAADVRAVARDYFRAMGIPLVRGRVVTDRDGAADPKVLVINQALARRYFAGEDPIGRRLKVEWGDSVGGEIVGVVGDVKHAGLDSVPSPTIYLPAPQFPFPAMAVVVRTRSDPLAMAAAVRGAVRELDPDIPTADVKTMEQYVETSVARRRFTMLLLGGFAALALVLAALGIYSVIAYSVARRTREIGLRIALGAQRGDVAAMVVRQGVTVALVGVAVGLAGAALLTRVLANLLFGVSATDPLTFAGVALLLGTVAALASYIPARRAMRVDPMVALRTE